MGHLKWEDVALFENRDYLSAKYQDVLRLELSREKAIQIIANLRQGREYFIAAKNAAALVRPLLIYYGMLSTSRAIILFRTGRDEATLAGSHGLKMTDWASKQSVERVSINLLEMKCEVQEKGTFRELLSATNYGRHYVAVAPMHPGKPLVCQRLFAVPASATKTIVSFDDVASRIADLGGLYQDLLGRNNVVYSAYVFSIGAQTDYTIYPYDPDSDLPIIRNLFNIPDDNPMTLGAGQDGPAYAIRREGPPEAQSDAPLIVYGDESTTPASNSIIPPIKGVGNVAVLGTMFLFSYFAGMLVRYKPSAWYSLQSKLRGDAALPILETGLEIIEENLPGYIVDEFAIPDPNKWFGQAVT